MANHKKMLWVAAKYAREHQEEIRERNRRYNQKPERRRKAVENVARWRANNPGRRNQADRLRRARRAAEKMRAVIV